MINYTFKLFHQLCFTTVSDGANGSEGGGGGFQFRQKLYGSSKAGYIGFTGQAKCHLLNYHTSLIRGGVCLCKLVNISLWCVTSLFLLFQTIYFRLIKTSNNILALYLQRVTFRNFFHKIIFNKRLFPFKVYLKIFQSTLAIIGNRKFCQQDFTMTTGRVILWTGGLVVLSADFQQRVTSTYLRLSGTAQGILANKYEATTDFRKRRRKKIYFGGFYFGLPAGHVCHTSLLTASKI